MNLSLYEQSQRLVDAEKATYQSVLFNDDVTNFVGAFTCEVSNVRVTVPVQDTLELNGKLAIIIIIIMIIISPCSYWYVYDII